MVPLLEIYGELTRVKLRSWDASSAFCMCTFFCTTLCWVHWLFVQQIWMTITITSEFNNDVCFKICNIWAFTTPMNDVVMYWSMKKYCKLLFTLVYIHAKFQEQTQSCWITVYIGYILSHIVFFLFVSRLSTWVCSWIFCMDIYHDPVRVRHGRGPVSLRVCLGVK